MITIGLIKELYFIALFIRQPLKTCFGENGELSVNIYTNGIMEIYYKENFIWKETIEGKNSMFGIESCDAISRILNCIDNGDSGWKKYSYVE